MELKQSFFETRTIDGQSQPVLCLLLDGALPDEIQAEVNKVMGSGDYDELLELRLVLYKKLPRLEDLQRELEEKAEENAYLVDRAQGLVSPPVRGAAWDPNERYINGDVAAYKNEDFKATRYSKDKNPEDYPLYWESLKGDVAAIDWNLIESGATIQIGTVVFVDEDGPLYRSKIEHKKSIVRKPSPFSDFWEVKT